MASLDRYQGVEGCNSIGAVFSQYSTGFALVGPVFGFRAQLAASIEIIVLFAAIILTILSFRKVDDIAA
jgi:tryptophan-rich sensory protein